VQELQWIADFESCAVSQEQAGTLMLALWHVVTDGRLEGAMSGEEGVLLLVLLHFVASAGI
jgi:hypothetical protein